MLAFTISLVYWFNIEFDVYIKLALDYPLGSKAELIIIAYKVVNDRKL